MIDQQKTPAARLSVADERIDWVMSHPGMSEWLKSALRSSRSRNPVDTLNDLEIMAALLRERSQALIDQRLTGAAETVTDESRSSQDRITVESRSGNTAAEN